MVVISNLKELEKYKQSVLRYDERIFIKFYTEKRTFKYILRNNYLFCTNGENSSIFYYLYNNYNPVRNRKLISTIIGYASRWGNFPVYIYKDGNALYKILYTLFLMVGKKTGTLYTNSKIAIQKDTKMYINTPNNKKERVDWLYWFYNKKLTKTYLNMKSSNTLKKWIFNLKINNKTKETK